jgi:hypothetical protein
MASIQRLNDFYQGDTKRWAFESEQDLTGSLFVFRMAKDLEQPTPDLEIEGVLDSPVPSLNTIHRVWFTIPGNLSAGLAPGAYLCHHRWRDAQGLVLTFLQTPIVVKPSLPKGQSVI